ncbi:hypothetical protein AB0N79_35595 [Streptomyces microflavus]|uniref:hypothetical protein n=1 Tax=Streptomyces microflavus TaxID=1919 RepID=UPI002250310A|nr:hypothetical protein [Streptomyces microflavus]MCX4657380.1 hypothetical protein [Streptomyces microflavus]
MSSSPQTRAYPEPAAHPLWRRHQRPRPLTPAQQKRNRELLLTAQHTPRPRTPKPSAEASR